MICEHCNNKFAPVRSDQKFCSPKCRNTYHNELNRMARERTEEITKEIHKTLWKNRVILKKYLGMEVDFLKLTREGFNSNFITQFVQNSKGKTEFLCYDIRYTFSDEQTIKIFDHETHT